MQNVVWIIVKTFDYKYYPYTFMYVLSGLRTIGFLISNMIFFWEIDISWENEKLNNIGLLFILKQHRVVVPFFFGKLIQTLLSMMTK